MFWEKYGFPWVEQKTKLIIGHRGSILNYPENTFLSFDKAIEEGAKGIECDIWKSSDDEYVIIHDGTVDRTTNSTGNVSDFTLAELTSMDAGGWFDSQFADQEDTKIPSLTGFINRYGEQDIFLNMHIKLGLTDIYNIVDILDANNILNHCFIFAAIDSIGYVKEYNPRTFVMNASYTTPSVFLTQAENENWNAFSTAIANIDEDVVNITNKAGFYLQGSYISSNFTTETQNFIDMGVNFLLGNDCLTMVNVLTSNDIEQITPSDWSK